MRVNMSEEDARQLYATFLERKRLVVSGVDALHALKEFLEYAVRKKGVCIEWDPSTPPALRERLTIMSMSAARWTLAGAVAGLVVGALTDRPGLCTGVGAGVGAVLGGIQGHCAVESGWRLRGYHDEQGVEYVEILVRALPEGT